MPETVIKAMRALGFPGCRNTKYYHDEILAGIKDKPDLYALVLEKAYSNPGKEMDPLQKRQLELQVELLETKVKRETKELVSRDDFHFQIQKGAAGMIQVAERHLSPEAFNVFCKEAKQFLEDLATQLAS